MGHPPTSERTNAAIARMNYLHGRYRKAGKISNDDMLYTLSLFVLEVERWISLYEWRKLTPMEMCAIATHWKAIGDAMGIDYSPLKHGPNAFLDGIEFFEDIQEWADQYERKYMVPNKWNHQLAEETSAILLTNVPGPMKSTAKNFVKALMTDRLRKSMMYEDPPAIYPRLINLIFGVRKVLMTYLFPPRPWALRFSPLSEKPDPKTGRYFMAEYDNQPW
jgi:hypothetical protein